MVFLKLGENSGLKDLEYSAKLKNLDIGNERVRELERLGSKTSH